MKVIQRLGMWLTCGALVAGSAASFLGPLWWRLGLLSHFRLHALVVSVILALLFLLMRWRAGWVSAALCAALHGAAVIAVLWGRPTLEAPPAQAQTLKVLTANVLGTNPDMGPLIALIAVERPDLVGVQEVRQTAANALGALIDYPHRVIVPQPDNFGIGLLSRAPLSDVQIHHWEGFVSVSAYVMPDGPWVLVTHPPPPMSAEAAEARDRVLTAVAAEAAAQAAAAKPVVVLGDFNQTPWGAGFSGWLQGAGLREARPRWRFSPTWPSGSTLWAGIPIDHVLIGPSWRLSGFEVGPDIGSDHRPVIVTLWRAP
jgi:endonuclease/exonuclease/phosphatase (EEP) superfamily protein YafD